MKWFRNASIRFGLIGSTCKHFTLYTMSIHKSRKQLVFPHPTLLWCPRSGEPVRISGWYLSRKNYGVGSYNRLHFDFDAWNLTAKLLLFLSGTQHTDSTINQNKSVNQLYDMWPYVGKSSTSLLAGVKAGRIHLCRVAGNSVIPYGRWHSVAQGRVLVEARRGLYSGLTLIFNCSYAVLVFHN